MPLIDQPPYVRILLAMAEDMAAVDYHELAGMPAGQEAKIRHSRKRHPVRGDRPCHTLIFVADERRAGESDLTMWEVERELTVDIQTDVEVATEASEDDPTGLAYLGRMAAAAIAAIRDPDSSTMALVQDIAEGDVEPEDRAQADDGRLVRSVTVLYRVQSQNGNMLLAEGENG